MALVLIGMSGGVGSSVAASILKRDAHQVVGVTFLFDGSATSRDAAVQATRIADKLGIEHHVVDACKRYEQDFAAPMARLMASGAQPSFAAEFTNRLLLPLLFEQAQERKAMQVATGHYAGTVMESNGIGTYPWRLMRAHDTYNDQSFLLYRLSQDQLNRLRFPLADMQEMRVRVDAMRAGLMVPQVPAGEGLHLYGAGSQDLESWLVARGVAECPGTCVDLASGTALGSCDNVVTCGAGDKLCFANLRAGLPVEGFAALDRQVDGSDAGEEQDAPESARVPVEPDFIERYVVARDLGSHTVYVGSAAQASKESCVVREVNWTSIHAIDSKRSCRVRLAAQDNPRPCTLTPMPDGQVMMSFTLPVAGLAAGKTAVFYSDNMVLGGGIIV